MSCSGTGSPGSMRTRRFEQRSKRFRAATHATNGALALLSGRSARRSETNSSMPDTIRCRMCMLPVVSASRPAVGWRKRKSATPPKPYTEFTLVVANPKPLRNVRRLPTPWRRIMLPGILWESTSTLCKAIRTSPFTAPTRSISALTPSASWPPCSATDHVRFGKAGTDSAMG